MENYLLIELPSGAWRCQVMVQGKRISVVDDDPEVAHTKALAMKTGILEGKSKKEKVTLNDAIIRYIQAGEGTLSPTTIRGYETIRKHRFPCAKTAVLCLQWIAVFSFGFSGLKKFRGK